MSRAVRATTLAAVLLTLFACGSGGQPAQPAGSIKVTMSEFKFEPKAMTAKPGKAVFFLVNTGSTNHDMVIADPSGKVVARSDQVGAGDSAVFTVDNLAAGSYQVFCDLPGHKESGMTATLEVA